MYKLILTVTGVSSVEILYWQEIDIKIKIACQILITIATIYLLINKSKSNDNNKSI